MKLYLGGYIVADKSDVRMPGLQKVQVDGWVNKDIFIPTDPEENEVQEGKSFAIAIEDYMIGVAEEMFYEKYSLLYESLAELKKRVLFTFGLVSYNEE